MLITFRIFLVIVKVLLICVETIIPFCCELILGSGLGSLQERVAFSYSVDSCALLWEVIDLRRRVEFEKGSVPREIGHKLGEVGGRAGRANDPPVREERVETSSTE